MGTQAVWSPVGQGCPKSEVSSFLPTYSGKDTAPPLHLGGAEAETPFRDQKQNPLVSAGSSLVYSFHSHTLSAGSMPGRGGYREN